MRYPTRVFSREQITTEDICEFGMELTAKHIHRDIRELFLKLASKPAAKRMLVNIITVSQLLSDNAVLDVLHNGLTLSERQALISLEDAKVSPRNLEIAHGLLNIHTRWCAVRAVRKQFEAVNEYY